MILLHGNTFGSIGGAESVVAEAEAFARELCFAGLAVSLPGYGATEVSPGADPNNILKVTLNVVLDGVSSVNKLPWIDAKRLSFMVTPVAHSLLRCWSAESKESKG